MVAQGEIQIGEAHDSEHCGEHCPFLNRSDQRCSDCLSLDRLDHAFDFCFGSYKACPVYLEMLAERRVRRLCGLLTPPVSPARTEAGQSDVARPNRRPLVQVSLPRPGSSSVAPAATTGSPSHRYPQRPARAALVPAASGV
jgi:hypothetical protein